MSDTVIPTQANIERLAKQLGLALEALEAIMEGAAAQLVAQQALDDIARIGMVAIDIASEQSRSTDGEVGERSRHWNAEDDEALLRELDVVAANIDTPRHDPDNPAREAARALRGYIAKDQLQVDRILSLTTDRDQWKARAERLREALEPFALLATDGEGDPGANMNDPLSKWFTIAQLVTARAALAPHGAEEAPAQRAITAIEADEMGGAVDG